MGKDCRLCRHLEAPKFRVYTGHYWSAGLNDNQAYLGRSYITLYDHKSNLGELNPGEWREFTTIVGKLEAVYRLALGADLLNLLYFPNATHSVKSASDLHVYWHIYPRYSKPKTMLGHTFEDPTYGKLYSPKRQQAMPNDFMDQLAALLGEQLRSRL